MRTWREVRNFATQKFHLTPAASWMWRIRQGFPVVQNCTLKKTVSFITLSKFCWSSSWFNIPFKMHVCGALWFLLQRSTALSEGTFCGDWLLLDLNWRISSTSVTINFGLHKNVRWKCSSLSWKVIFYKITKVRFHE